MLEQFNLFSEIDYLIKRAIAIEWKRQGHDLTGKAIQDIDSVIRRIPGGEVIDYYIADYMAYNNSGVLDTKIPYTRGSGKKKSKYIAGLTEYVKKRMRKSEREAQSIAFAIASRHKKEGMPTKASSRFSKSGKRTGFIEIALDDIEPKLAALIEQGVEESINFVLESFFKTQINR